MVTYVKQQFHQSSFHKVDHHVEHRPAVHAHHADPVYVEEPAVYARPAPAPVATAVAYTPESVAAVAHRAEAAYIQGNQSAQWDIADNFKYCYVLSELE